MIVLYTNHLPDEPPRVGLFYRQFYLELAIYGAKSCSLALPDYPRPSAPSWLHSYPNQQHISCCCTLRGTVSQPAAHGAEHLPTTQSGPSLPPRPGWLHLSITGCQSSAIPAHTRPCAHRTSPPGSQAEPTRAPPVPTPIGGVAYRATYTHPNQPLEHGYRVDSLWGAHRALPVPPRAAVVDFVPRPPTAPAARAGVDLQHKSVNAKVPKHPQDPYTT